MKYSAVSHDGGMQFDSREAVVERFLQEVREKINNYDSQTYCLNELTELLEIYKRAVGDIVIENGVLRIDFKLIEEEYIKILRHEDVLFEEWNWLFDSGSKYGYTLELWDGNKRLR